MSVLGVLAIAYMLLDFSFNQPKPISYQFKIPSLQSIGEKPYSECPVFGYFLELCGKGIFGDSHPAVVRMRESKLVAEVA